MLHYVLKSVEETRDHPPSLLRNLLKREKTLLQRVQRIGEDTKEAVTEVYSSLESKINTQARFYNQRIQRIGEDTKEVIAGLYSRLEAKVSTQIRLVNRLNVKLDDLGIEIQNVSVTSQTLTNRERRNNNTAGSRLDRLSSESACIGRAMLGYVFVAGSDAAGQSAAALNDAVAGDATVDLTWVLRSKGGTPSAPLTTDHIGWPNGLHPKISSSKDTVTDADIAAPSYYQGVLPIAIGGTATWGALPAWAASTAYSVDDVVENSAAGGGDNVYVCTVGGTSAGSGGPTGDDAAITDNDITWKFVGKGTLGVLMTDTTGVLVGGAGRLDSDRQWFEFTAVETDVVAVIKNPHSHTVPSGAGASSVGDLPVFDEDGQMTLTTVLDTDDGATKTWIDAENQKLSVDVSTLTAPIDMSAVSPKELNIPIIA